MESFSKKRPSTHETYVSPHQSGREYTQSDVDEAQAHFSPLEEKFNALAETAGQMRFSVGEKIKYPASQGSESLVDWNIVRAEKKHYLLERKIQNELFDHVLCSEEEILEHSM